jgi:hypothetical protein
MDLVWARDLIWVMMPQQLKSEGVASVISSSGARASICSTPSADSLAIS